MTCWNRKKPNKALILITEFPHVVQQWACGGAIFCFLFWKREDISGNSLCIHVLLLSQKLSMGGTLCTAQFVFLCLYSWMCACSFDADVRWLIANIKMLDYKLYIMRYKKILQMPIFAYGYGDSYNHIVHRSLSCRALITELVLSPSIRPCLPTLLPFRDVVHIMTSRCHKSSSKPGCSSMHQDHILSSSLLIANFTCNRDVWSHDTDFFGWVKSSM